MDTSLERIDLHWSRHWTFVRQRARKLFQRDPIPGIDYCMTEEIHCKSREQIGVGAAFDTCRERYLRPILDASGARVVVAMGDYAARGIRSTLELDGNRGVVGSLTWGTREVYVAFTHRPAVWRGGKRLDKCFTADELTLFCSTLSKP